MKREILKQLAFIVGGCMMALNANANNDDLEGWTPYMGCSNVKVDPTTNVVSFDNARSGSPWACQFDPPTWYGPGNNQNEDFEISFDAKYVGEGTDGNGKGHITFSQGRQYPSNNNYAALCASLGIEKVNDGWQIQCAVDQMIVSNCTAAPEDFSIGRLTRNVNFYPTNEWQTFSFSGHLGRHAADSVDIAMEFGKIAGSYSIRNFVFKVDGAVFAKYFWDVVDDDNFSYYVDNQYAIVKKFNGNLQNVTIPPKIVVDGKEVPVTSISYGAFSGCSNLVSVTIPNSITVIGGGTFSNCNSLQSIIFGSSVAEIGSEVFDGCNSLRSIVCKGKVPPVVKNNQLTSRDLYDVLLYANVILSFPDDANLYRKMQPWCNFDFAASEEHKADTIYVIGTSAGRFSIKTTTADAKMGMGIGTAKYEKDELAEIVAIEKYGYHFTKWSDGNTDNPRFVKVTSDSTFTAQFEVNNYSVLAAANEKGMGKVEGAAEYAYLSRTQLKAIPNAGYQFKEWSDGETANPRNILVYSDTVFTAIFAADGSEPVPTAVADNATTAITIYAHGNTIVVENATDEIFVYNTMGALICRDAINRVRMEINVNTPGIYIVKTGGTVKRVMVN